MGVFRVWIEAQDRNERKIRQIYDQVARRFMGETGDVTDQLSKIGKKDVGAKKGAKAAFKILNNMQVFDKLEALGEEWRERVENTRSWLQTGTKIGTVGQLLEKLFGDEHLKYQGYAFKKPDLDKEAPPPEEGNAKVGDATSQPMAQEQPPQPPIPPEMQQQPPPGMIPPPGQPPPPGMIPPQGMMPPQPGMV